MDKDGEGRAGSSRNIYAINSFLGDINLGSGRDTKRISEKGSIVDLVKIRGLTNLIKEDFNKAGVSEVRGDPKEFDSGVEILEGITGDISGRFIPFKQEGVMATHNPRLTSKNIEHFFRGF